MIELPICSVCNVDEYNNDFIILRLGNTRISPKHKQSYFHPDTFDDGDKEKIFHLHCLQTLDFDFAYAYNYDDPEYCVFCNDLLNNEVMYFELELGRFDINSYWIPERHKQKIYRLYACWDCIFDGIGEGCADIARKRLGLKETK